jgi:hypothetical protein
MQIKREILKQYNDQEQGRDVESCTNLKNETVRIRRRSYWLCMYKNVLWVIVFGSQGKNKMSCFEFKTFYKNKF